MLGAGIGLGPVAPLDDLVAELGSCRRPARYSAGPCAADNRAAPGAAWPATARCRRWRRKLPPALAGQRRCLEPLARRYRRALRGRAAAIVLQADDAQLVASPRCCRRRCAIVDSSRLPPPRSPTMPEKSGMPATTPSAAKWASCSPLSTCTLALHDRFDRVDEGLASWLASRTAEVASTCTLPTRISRATSAKRWMAVSARSTLSSASLPLVRDAASQRTGRFFVVERRQRAGMALIDDQTNRVGADIEHRDGLGALDASLRRRIGIHAPELVQSPPSSPSRIPALPRPDSDGLVMK